MMQYGTVQTGGFRCGTREVIASRGDVAQLVERLLCKQDVRSSNLLVSTFDCGKQNVGSNLIRADLLFRSS